MHAKYCAALLAAVGLLTTASGAATKEAEPERVDKVWTFIPKRGLEQKFDEAFAEHVKWRRDHDDPWHWEVFVQVDGPEVGARYARSGEHRWSDFDAYDASEFEAMAVKHWNATVAPLLDDASSVMGEGLTELSHWPMDAPQYELFQLYTYQIKPGQMQAFQQAIGAIAKTLKEASWPYHWAFVEHVTGKVPSVLLVIPSRDWAGLTEPDPNLFDTLAKVHGQAKAVEMLAAFSATVESTRSIIVRRIPALAVPGSQAKP